MSIFHWENNTFWVKQMENLTFVGRNCFFLWTHTWTRSCEVAVFVFALYTVIEALNQKDIIKRQQLFMFHSYYTMISVIIKQYRDIFGVCQIKSFYLKWLFWLEMRFCDLRGVDNFFCINLWNNLLFFFDYF